MKEIRKKLEGQPKEALTPLLPEVFAIVREVSSKVLRLRHFDEQLLGGIVLHQGKIAEMRTGEGKTLVATLPVSLNALLGRGVHVITVNDYLAKRDTQWMGALYHALGFSIGCIQHEAAFLYDPDFHPADERQDNLRPVDRREAYAADITYGTNNEFGFDYLRDNMVPDAAHKVQRDLFYAIVDEVDSILIDEARTPLIISAPAEESTDQYYRFSELVRQLESGADYVIDEKLRASTLTEAGIAKMEQALGIGNIYEAGGIETIHHLEQALKAQTLFQLDRDYVVKDGEVIIVDEFTGRLMFGRRYSEGLHQAIEAKEKVEIKKESETLATISFQNLFRIYEKLAGMTGTAVTEAEEFSKIYKLEVVIIPTHRPMVRKDQSDSVYQSEKGKFLAVVREVKRRHELGQPVLIGTISIEKNEILGELLSREGIPHELLNAKNHESEASIISQAGRRGAVTVATNMAGRGVDIILGGSPPNAEEADFVRSVGGLHVLGTERHESRRIDNQLRGRSGRQGDPGSSQFFVSMDDDLMRIFGSDRLKSLMSRLGVPEDVPIENALVSRSIESAQKKVEGHNFDIRKHLVEYDDVMNKHREVVYRKRSEFLAFQPDERKKKLLELVNNEISNVVSFHTASEDERTWAIEDIYKSVDALFPVSIEQRIKLDDLRGLAGDAARDAEARQSIIEYLSGLAKKSYEQIEQALGAERMRSIELGLALRTIDTLWIEHLDLMDHLRRGIGLRGYGQRDPLVEYKREAYGLFTQLMNSMNTTIVYSIFRMAVAQKVATQSPMQREKLLVSAPAKEMSTTQAPQAGSTSSSSLPVSTGPKVGRNDPCPCGSGKKYKKCHGA
jgi:preprotein translocase subunit SecA